jgi:hypothetical protein
MQYEGGEQVPVLRDGPDDDGLDALRCKLVTDRWNKQDMFLLERDVAVEDACRMLMGDQWSIWSPRLNKRVNLSDVMGMPDQAFQSLPCFNLVQKWYGLTLARLTENAPVLGAEPRDSDHESILLAEAADVVLPKLWDDCRMSEKTFEMVGWQAAAGWFFTKVTAETAEGAIVPMVGPAMLPAPDGSHVPVEHAAFDVHGQPMGSIVQQDDGTFGYHLGDDETAGTLTEGRPQVRVLSPLECRGEWGNHIPWQDKRWHIHLAFMEPQEVKKKFGVDCQPDTSVDGGTMMAHYRLRLERGSGHYGVTGQTAPSGPQGTGPQTDLCAVYEMWERPSKDFPEGRLLIVTNNYVLFDGERPFPKLKDYGYTSPIVYGEWLRQAGRGYGTTPLEMGLPIQRQINKGWRQILQHRARVTNPVAIFDRGAGLTEEDMDSFNTPGMRIGAEFPNGATSSYEPVRFVAPAPLSADVYKIQEMLTEQFNDIMGLAGAEGIAQGSDASGEQVKELRFNSDRPISVPVRNLATALEQVGNLMFCILPVVWPTQQLIHYLGDDNQARTMEILPEMWDGQCHVRIDAESMLPRSRQEREQMAMQRFMGGVYGPPGTPAATSKYMQQSAFPDNDQLTGPDGPTRPTANQLIGKILQGQDPRQIPMLMQWNYIVMRQVVEDHMAAPEFQKADIDQQARMQMFWERIDQAEMVQAVQKAAQAAKVQGALMVQQAPIALAQAHVAGAVAQISAPPAPPEPTASPS